MTAGDRIDTSGYERALNSAFSPHAPINETRLFAGRIPQVRAVVDTIRTTGLHAVIFGERGVGKTSLSIIIKDFLQDAVGISRVNCTEGERFASLIRRSLGAFQLSLTRPSAGLRSDVSTTVQEVVDLLPHDRDVSPDAVAELVAQLPPYFVLVIDEFDRLGRAETASFADLIKSLSDRGASTTMVLVGVAEDITQLIANHASVARCLRQIPLQRMSDDELGEIVDRGLEAAGLNLSSNAPKRRILSVSQGFPHYTHLLTLNAGRAALDRSSTTIDDDDVLNGMRAAVEASDHTHRDMYFRVVTGTRKENLWREVAASCALAQADERGYFSSRDVQDALSRITRRPVVQQTIAYHLGKMTEDDRGPLLERVGPERRYRYRFMNPLMKPFILMKSMSDGLVRP